VEEFMKFMPKRLSTMGTFAVCGVLFFVQIIIYDTDDRGELVFEGTCESAEVFNPNQSAEIICPDEIGSWTKDNWSTSIILARWDKEPSKIVYNCKVMDTAFGLNKVCDLVE